MFSCDRLPNNAFARPYAVTLLARSGGDQAVEGGDVGAGAGDDKVGVGGLIAIDVAMAQIGMFDIGIGF